MNETSLRAYAELKAQRKLQPMELKVLVALGERPRTRDEIAAFTGMRLSSVCGRVASLRAAGVIKELVQVRCPETGKMQALLTMRGDPGCPV